MLAVLGWVAVDFGLVMPEAPHVSSLYAHDATVETGSFIFLLIPLTVIELGAGVPKAFQLLNDPDAAAPGDYKFDPLGFSKDASPETMKKCVCRPPLPQPTHGAAHAPQLHSPFGRSK